MLEAVFQFLRQLVRYLNGSEMGINKWQKEKRKTSQFEGKCHVLSKPKLIDDAEAQHGKPYKNRKWKAQEIYNPNPVNFDCSSFVMWLYFRQGYKLPRWSQHQYIFCDSINENVVSHGDLYFLGKKLENNKISIKHVGMYTGSGMCMEAAGGRAKKVIRSMSERITNKKNFLGWRRVPLAKAEDTFFTWIKKYPQEKQDEKPPKACSDVRRPDTRTD